MNKPSRTPLAALGLAVLALTAFAQATLPQVDGEVRKIDAEQQKITLRHADIPNLAMSPMTMVFRAKDPAMLTRLAVGEKVSFTADRVDGVLTLISIDKGR